MTDPNPLETLIVATLKAVAQLCKQNNMEFTFSISQHGETIITEKEIGE